MPSPHDPRELYLDSSSSNPLAASLKAVKILSKIFKISDPASTVHLWSPEIHRVRPLMLPIVVLTAWTLPQESPLERELKRQKQHHNKSQKPLSSFPDLPTGFKKLLN